MKISLFVVPLILASFGLGGCGKGHHENLQEKVSDYNEDRIALLEKQEYGSGLGEEIPMPKNNDWKNAMWLTYKDESNDFELKYPDTYRLIDEYQNNGEYKMGDKRLEHIDTMRYLEELDYGAAALDNSIEIKIRENKERLSLPDWFGKNNLEHKKFTKVETYKIGDQNVLRYSKQSIVENETVCFMLGDKERVLIISWNGGNLDQDGGENVFKEILESFRNIR